jgi:sulfoxide reductase heme-binding subunit YedZ
MAFRLDTLWSKITLLCLLPLLGVMIDIVFDNLGPDPIQTLHIRLGDWAMRFLWLTLLVTPVQTITKWRGMAEYRQMLGLYAFFYATLHVMVYLLVDHGLMWQIIAIDILESSYIWFGLIAYLIMIALAISSPNWAKKQMGKQWKKLHRLIYIASLAVIIHYYWQLKGNMAEPLFYLIIILLLLAFRVALWFKNRKFTKMMIPTTRRIKVVSVAKVFNPELSIDIQGPVLKELIIQEVEPD